MSDKQPNELIRVKLAEGAVLPSKGSSSAAGLDLAAADTVRLVRGRVTKVRTGVYLEIPEGYFGMVLPRSGLGTGYGITLANTAGVIDSDYRGEIMLFMLNNGQEDYMVYPEDRVAQIILVPYLQNAVLKEVSELNSTERGAKGFGSTGK